MNALSLENISKAYPVYASEWFRVARWFGLPFKPIKSQQVLHDISFTIKAGESVGIVGQNGAGKSTLLKIITGTLLPTMGQLHVKGRVAAILELGIGLNIELTGRENVKHMCGLMGFSAQAIRNMMPDIEAFTDIGAYFDLPVRTYSSGMQMRIAFAVATASRPDILIVDEALSVGDAKFQAKCFARISAFKKQGTTLLLVSHHVEDIVKHCDRAIFLKAGKVVMDGSTREVTNHYLDALFGQNEKSKGGEAKTFMPADILATSLSTDLFSTRSGYNKEEHRWGQGGAKILDYYLQADGEAYPSSIASNAMVDFYFTVYFERDFEHVIPAMLIKSLEGLFLYGTNATLVSAHKNKIAVKSGEVRVFKFSFPLNLNQGAYLLSCGISSDENQAELIPLERRYDAIMLHVIRKAVFWGMIDLESTFNVVDEIRQ